MASPRDHRKPYTYQSMFWSDLGPKIGYEAIGRIDAKLNTKSFWTEGEEYKTGVVFYLDDHEIVGVLMMNLHERLQVAKMSLKQKDSNLANIIKSFNLYDANWT
eukprot:TRINITY_DN53518_c0_g1_i1.p1 TRINITY_DN53518_c0_g1~~TRINITY_DN53518_c0_g1_i1.p1  ORF type:complete len:120 (+),score=3.40 TRINITY_DN53518_c0_g1_i1:51-362(+)